MIVSPKTVRFDPFLKRERESELVNVCEREREKQIVYVDNGE